MLRSLPFYKLHVGCGIKRRGHVQREVIHILEKRCKTFLRLLPFDCIKIHASLGVDTDFSSHLFPGVFLGFYETFRVFFMLKLPYVILIYYIPESIFISLIRELIISKAY